MGSIQFKQDQWVIWSACLQDRLDYDYEEEEVGHKYVIPSVEFFHDFASPAVENNKWKKGILVGPLDFP